MHGDGDINDRLRKLLSLLESVSHPSDGQWEARCPAHDDNRASLAIGLIGSGIGVHCHAGCDTSDVLAKVGMTLSDLFPESRGDGPRGTIVATYDYRDTDGSVVFQVVRFEPKDFRQRKPDGSGGWTWSVKGLKVIPYRLPELMAADPSQPVFVCEGEKDCDRLAAIGLVATCNAGGAARRSEKNPRPSCKWRKAHAGYLTGRNVVVIPDNDQPGRDHADGVARTLYGKAASLKIAELPDLPNKGDLSDWLDAGGSAESLLAIAAAAPAWTQSDHRSAVTTADDSGTAAERRLTDLGNAERFAAQHGANVRYCHAWNSWLVWDGTRWVVDCMGEINRLAKRTVRRIYEEAADEGLTTGEVKEIAKWAHDSERASSIRAMLALARCEQPIPIGVDSLDSDPWLLNCENGTINLATGHLLPHAQENFLTKRCPVEYPTEAGDEPVLWIEFLDKIFDSNRELIDFVQRLMGLSLVGEVREHILPILWGNGSNGKSVLIETWCGILGDGYAMKAPQGFLMARRGETHPTELADLHGKRLVAAVETADGSRLSESLVKELTGGDTIRARRMREDFWQFRPSHTAIMATNHKPVVRGTDYGLWRRLRLVPFTVTIKDEEKDERLTEKLREEWPAILKWAVAGCLDWQRGGLRAPEIVLLATEEYRSTSDVFGSFIDECCLTGRIYRIKASSLYQFYKSWAEANGEFVETQTKFGTRLSERGFERVRSNGFWWVGITNREVANTGESSF